MDATRPTGTVSPREWSTIVGMGEGATRQALRELRLTASKDSFGRRWIPEVEIAKRFALELTSLVTQTATLAMLRRNAETARVELERLWEREMFMGSYAARWLGCRLGSKTDNRSHVSALAFVVRRDASNYAGKLTEAEILAVFERGSCGRFGTSLDYLIRTVTSLRQYGLSDPQLEQLARQAGAPIEQLAKIAP